MGALSQPIAELLARLVYHAAAPGRILEGWKIDGTAVTQAAGVDDHPRVNCVGIALSDDSRSQNQTFASVTIRMGIASKKTGGLDGHAADVERVLDAIETNTAGEVDFSVGNSTIRGVRITGDDTDVSGVAFQTMVAVNLETVPFMRGARRTAP